MTGNGPVRFGGRPCGKGTAQRRSPRRAADPTRTNDLHHLGVVWHDLAARWRVCALVALVLVVVPRVWGELPPLGWVATGSGGRDPGPWAGGPGGSGAAPRMGVKVVSVV